MKLTELFTELIEDNTCINCGNIVDENLRKWFKDRWVNIGKKKKGGGHPPCGTSGKKRGYAKCVPASKKQVLLVEREQHRIKLVEVVRLHQDKGRNQYTFLQSQRNDKVKTTNI